MAEDTIIRDPRTAANFLLRRYRDEPDFEFTEEEAGIVHSAYEGRIPFIENRPVLDEGSTVEFLRSQEADPTFVASEDEFNILQQSDPGFMEKVSAGAQGMADYAGQTLSGAVQDIGENIGRPSSILKAPGTALEAGARGISDITNLISGARRFVEKTPEMIGGATGLMDDYQSYLAQKKIDQRYFDPAADENYVKRARGESVIGLPEGSFMPGLAEVGSLAADPTIPLGFGAGMKAAKAATLPQRAIQAGTRTAEAVETAGRAVATPIRSALETVDKAVSDIPAAGVRGLARKGVGIVETIPEAVAAGAEATEKTAQAARVVGQEILQGPSQFTVMERVAKDVNNPSWLRRAANFALVKSPAIEEAAGTAAAATGGALRGAGVGGAIGFVGSGGEEEGLGAGLAMGAPLGAAGGVVGRVTGAGQRKAIAQQADVDRLFARQAELGLDVGRISQYAAKDNRPFLDAATFQRIAPDTQVEFHTRDSFARPENAGIDAAGAVKAVQDKSGRIRMLVNLDDRRATGDTVRHEMIHALMKSPAINKSEGRMAVFEVYGDKGVEARGAEYAKKLLMAETDGRRIPTEAEVRAKMDQLRDDARAVDPRSGELDWAADEILAEQFQAEFRGMDLNDLRRRTPPGTNVARLQEGMLAPVGRVLSSLGLDLNQPRPANIDSIFADNPLTPSPRLRELTARWFRERDKYLDGLAKAETTKDAPLVTGAGNRNLANNPAVTFTKNKSGIDENDFAYRFPDGTVRLKNQPNEIAGIRAIEAARIGDVKGLYDPNRILERADPVFGKKLQADGKEYVGGPTLPDGFYQLDSFNDFHKNLAREYESARDTGRTFSIWYQKIGSGDEGSWAAAVKKNLGNVKVGQAEVAPVAWRLSKNGNILLQAVDITALRGRMLDLRRTGKGRVDELWGGDLAAYQKDLFQYLDNHKNNLPGDTGIGSAKRDALNYLFGFGRKEVNPLNQEGKLPGSLIKSYRLDRIANSRETGQTGWFIDYGKQAQNLAPGDVSLQMAVYEKMPERATPDQVRAIIRPGQARGVNEEDLKWSGINQAIDRLAAENQGKVPKDKLLQFLENDGKVKFDEVRYGGNRPNLESEAEFEARRSSASNLSREERDRLVEMRQRYQRSAGDAVDANNFGLATEFRQQASAIGELLDPQPKVRPARFEQYTLPGGENYREVVLTRNDPDNVKQYRSQHYQDAPGYIAHMRLTDRPDAQGRPGLFMEEVQSDRHQAGRDKGYLEDQEKLDLRRAEIEAKGQAATLEERKEWAEAMNRGALRKDGPPDAPFRKDWPVQMFRRALKEAVMDGKEWVGWTIGETQAARYDLSKSIDELTYDPDGKHLVARNKGFTVMQESGVEPGNVKDFVGKEPAERLLQSPKDKFGVQVIEGENLKLGGEGMKAFYDKILPNEVAKYVKQWGGTVEKSSVPIRTASRAEPDIFGDYTVPKGPKRTETAEIWKVRVTPEMVDGIKKLDEIGNELKPNGKTQIQFSPKTLTDEEFTATLRKAAGDPEENLRFRLARREDTGVAKNKLTEFTTKDGKPIVVGASMEDGGKPFAAWQRETESWLSKDEISVFRKWYDELPDIFREKFDEDPGRYMVSWLAGQQNASPAQAMGIMFRAMDRIAGIISINENTGRLLKGGLADDKVEAILQGKTPEGGYGPKLTDFADAGLGRSTRSYMGDDPRGGEPFVADVHTGRDSGHVDQQTLTRLVSLSEKGDLFINGKPAKLAVTQFKSVTSNGKTTKVPERVVVRQDGEKSYSLFPDMRGSPGANQYEGISIWGNRLSDFLNQQNWEGGNWKPAQVQAVGWMRILRQYGLTEGTAESAFRANTRDIYAEVNYSSGAVLPRMFPEFQSLRPDQQAAITSAVIEKTVDDLVGIIGGSLRKISVTTGRGYFGGQQSPSMMIRAMGSKEVSDMLTASLAYVSEQTMAMSVINGQGGQSSKGVYIRKAEGAPFSAAELETLSQIEEIKGFSVFPVDGYDTVFIADAGKDLRPKGFSEQKAEQIRFALSKWVVAQGIKEIDIDTSPCKFETYGQDYQKQPSGDTFLRAFISRGGGQKVRRLIQYRGQYIKNLREAFAKFAPEQPIRKEDPEIRGKISQAQKDILVEEAVYRRRIEKALKEEGK